MGPTTAGPRVWVRLLRAAFPGTTACWDGDAVALACPVGLPEIGQEDLLAALVS